MAIRVRTPPFRNKQDIIPRRKLFLPAPGPPPTFDFIEDQHAIRGAPFSYMPPVNNPGAWVLTFSIIDGLLPPGFFINSNTGEITGSSPTEQIVSGLKFRITYANGIVDSNAFDFTVQILTDFITKLGGAGFQANWSITATHLPLKQSMPTEFISKLGGAGFQANWAITATHTPIKQSNPSEPISLLGGSGIQPLYTKTSIQAPTIGLAEISEDPTMRLLSVLLPNRNSILNRRLSQINIYRDQAGVFELYTTLTIPDAITVQLSIQVPSTATPTTRWAATVLRQEPQAAESAYSNIAIDVTTIPPAALISRLGGSGVQARWVRNGQDAIKAG